MGAVFPQTTRFGAPARPLESAGAVLRARARRSGAELRTVMPVDLLAAAVVADAWSELLGGASLDDAGHHGAGALAVLAAALARAAGHGGEAVEVPVIECPLSKEMLLLAEEHRSWVEELCPDAPAGVLMRAGSDLYAAGPATRFAAYGALLQLTADNLP